MSTKKTIKELPKILRPREKLQKYGIQKLNNKELLALILSSGTKNNNVLHVAQKVLKKLKKSDLNKPLNMELFKGIKGVGEVKAGKIIASLELAKRLINKQEELQNFHTPRDIYNRLTHIKNSKKEHFIVFYLDVKNNELAMETISIGTLTQSLVHPREVFEPAIKYLACKIIIAHNHPSGIVKPSYEDINVTKKLQKAGKILGIKLIDHIIVGKTNYFSFKEEGLI